MYRLRAIPHQKSASLWEELRRQHRYFHNQRWRDSQLPFAARLHSCNAFIPAPNHLPLSQREHKWLATVQGAVELFTTAQPPGVVHAYGLSWDCCGARADDNVPVLKAGSRSRRLAVHFCRAGRARCTGLVGRAGFFGIATPGRKPENRENNQKQYQLLSIQWTLDRRIIY